MLHFEYSVKETVAIGDWPSSLDRSPSTLLWWVTPAKNKTNKQKKLKKSLGSKVRENSKFPFVSCGIWNAEYKDSILEWTIKQNHISKREFSKWDLQLSWGRENIWDFLSSVKFSKIQNLGLWTHFTKDLNVNNFKLTY